MARDRRQKEDIDPKTDVEVCCFVILRVQELQLDLETCLDRGKVCFGGGKVGHVVGLRR